MSDARIGIVGAGMAGVGVADALRETDASVTIVEKSRGVGGRAATRRKRGCRYDHGANYVKDPDGRTTDLIESLGPDGLVDVAEPVQPFGADGEIRESDRPEDGKYTWERGITQFAKRLLARTDAEVRHGVRAVALERNGNGDRKGGEAVDGTTDDAGTNAETTDATWTVTDADGDEHGPFDALVVTPPAPQTAALLTETTWSGGESTLARLRDHAESVPYRTIRTIVLHYGRKLDVPWYGLVNDDKEHAVGWVSREECKPGHVPDGESLLIVQMSPAWSRERYDDPLATVAPDVADRVADLVGVDWLRDPTWTDDQGWRYALPDDGVDSDAPAFETARDAGLHLVGDWVAGAGRVHEALWNGVAAGERLRERR